MTGIAINRQEARPARILVAMLLVAAGLLAGFGLAQVAPRDISTSAQTSGATSPTLHHVGDAGP